MKKIIEAFLRQMQQKKNRNLYTNLTTAPSKLRLQKNHIFMQFYVIETCSSTISPKIRYVVTSPGGQGDGARMAYVVESIVLFCLFIQIICNKNKGKNAVTTTRH